MIREALDAHDVEGELVVISNGEDAIRYIESSESDCPDLVIVDLNLPRRSGREVLAALSRRGPWRESVVVVLSSSDASQDCAASLALGARQYIRKPMRLSEYIAIGAQFKALLESR